MSGFFHRLIDRFQAKAEIDWDLLEADLVRADIGIRTTTQIIDELQDLGRTVNANDIVEVTQKHLMAKLPGDAFVPDKHIGVPTVITVLGVNGTGKTTSSAKLAKFLTEQGHRVLLAAADTFRAAAVEQLQVWADRLNVPVYIGRPNQDPSSVCFEAHRRAIEERFDYLICDTAGRLHTRHNLMEELAKIRRTLAKQDPDAPHHSLLVVDATTGGNALAQAKEFAKAIPLNGLILTKLDGSGKGGIAIPIFQELKIPPHFIGTGEEASQFELYQRERFVKQIL